MSSVSWLAVLCGFPVALVSGAVWLSRGFGPPRGLSQSAVILANGNSPQSAKASSPQKGQCASLQVPFEKVILSGIKIPIKEPVE